MCNAILFVSQLIRKCFRWQFLDIFEDVCLLHKCYLADLFQLLRYIMHANVRKVFWETRYIATSATDLSANLASLEACLDSLNSWFFHHLRSFPAFFHYFHFLPFQFFLILVVFTSVIFLILSVLYSTLFLFSVSLISLSFFHSNLKTFLFLKSYPP